MEFPGVLRRASEPSLKSIEILVVYEDRGKYSQTHHPLVECTRHFRVENRPLSISTRIGGGDPVYVINHINSEVAGCAFAVRWPAANGSEEPMGTNDASCTVTIREKRRPARIEERPDPSAWGDDELLTLAEAAFLFWPAGPLSETSLRTAVRDRHLDVAEIAGKLLTSKSAIRRMSVCRPRAGQGPVVAPVDPPEDRKPPSNRELLRRLSED
jgi:hypothetical protein